MSDTRSEHLSLLTLFSQVWAFAHESTANEGERDWLRELRDEFNHAHYITEPAGPARGIAAQGCTTTTQTAPDAREESHR